MILSLLLSGAAGAQPVPSDAKQEAKARFVSGQSHYNLNEFPEALADFKDAYRLYPDPVFLYNLGQCERQLGHYDEAIRFYRNFLREQPKAANRQEVLHKIDEMEAALKNRPPESTAAVPATPDGSKAEGADPALAPAPIAPAAPVAVTPGGSAPASLSVAAASAITPRPAGDGSPSSTPATAQADLAGRLAATPAPAPSAGPAFYRRWWFWTAAAVVVIGAAATIYATTSQAAPSPPTTILGTQRVF